MLFTKKYKYTLYEHHAMLNCVVHNANNNCETDAYRRQKLSAQNYRSIDIVKPINRITSVVEHMW